MVKIKILMNVIIHGHETTKCRVGHVHVYLNLVNGMRKRGMLVGPFPLPCLVLIAVLTDITSAFAMFC